MAIRILIIGGGFGGLEAAFSLRGLLKPAVEITLIDKSSFHCFLPSIHLIISGRVKPEQIRIPFAGMLGVAGIRFVQDEVSNIDAGSQEVRTTGSVLPYDHLVIATGATGNFFDIPGAEKFSRRFRTAEDAERIRVDLLRLMRAALPCGIVVAGAGTEGVEVIGELIDVVRDEGRGEDLARGAVSIELIEGRKRLLPDFSLPAQDLAEDHLRRERVVLVAGDRIAEVTGQGVTTESGRIHPASLVIWAGGIQPSKLIRGLPLEKDPWGWLKVNDRLQVPGDERIYGVGDAVSVYTENGPLSLQRLAYHAQDQARIAAFNIAASVNGARQIRYEPGSRPQLISIGKSMGIVSAEGRAWSGPWVVSLKKAVERRHLLSYLSRPVSSAFSSRLPGAAALLRFRTLLPL